MPMFDIKNSKNVNLTENETNQKDFAKLENVENVKAFRNKANSTNDRRGGIWKWINENIVKVIWGGVVGVAIAAIAASPWLKSLFNA